MDSEREIQGFEFDWYAVDKDGYVAVFSTAGEGFVPLSVRDALSHHDLISESIPSPNFGTLKVWGDIASLGLYVYDWQLPGGPYQRVASPTRELDELLRSRVLAVPGLPRLVFAFAPCDAISTGALAGST